MKVIIIPIVISSFGTVTNADVKNFHGVNNNNNNNNKVVEGDPLVIVQEM